MVIIGRGIAALQAHRLLAEADPSASIAVVGPGEPVPSSAAGLPEAIVHPFPGRSFNVPEEQWEAIASMRAFLDWLEEHYPQHLFRTTMVRPMLSGVMERLERSKASQHQRLDAAGIPVDARNLPAAFAVRRALSYPAAIVSMRTLLRDYFGSVSQLVEGKVVDVDASSDGLAVHCSDRQTLRARRVIWAVGASPGRPVKTPNQTVDAGSTLYGELASEVDIPRAWSAGVHMARGRGDLWGLGATHFDGASMTAVDAAAALVPKLEQVLPDHGFTPSTVYSGARLVMKDRRPFVGEISPGQWVLTGFGGTGLLWSGVCAEWLIREMSGGPSVPRIVSASR